ncbi:MAG: dTMP kinase [Candidatus Saccharimonadales bacterium]
METSALFSTGKLFMFDGPDGVGKTTQLNMAAEALTKKGYEVYLTKTHGGTPIGEALRTVSLSEVERTPLTDMYISLAMHSALAEVIEEKRDRGVIVLVDRSPLSIVAYQAYGSGLDKDFTMGIIDIDMQLFKPDCIIVYDAPIAITRQRMLERNKKNHTKQEYFESKSPEYFERVARGYRDAANHFHAEVIEATDTPEQVHKRTMKHLKTLLV